MMKAPRYPGWWDCLGPRTRRGRCVVVLMIRLDRDGSWDKGTGFALGVAVMCSVFSACCSVIVAIKSSEVRVRRELRHLTAPQR